MTSHRPPSTRRATAPPGVPRHRGARRFVVLLLATALGLLSQGSLTATIYTYDNTTSGTIAVTSTAVDANPLGLCDTGGPGTVIERSFVVAESFTLQAVSLGLNLSHNSRDDIVVVLESPAGTRVVVLNDTSNDGNNNYDLILVDNGEINDPDDGDADDLDEPLYHREIDVNALATFDGESSVGTWTAFICDDTNGTNGTFNAARLVLLSAETVTAACGGSSVYDWGDNGNNAFVSASEDGVTITEDRTRDVYGNGLAGSNFETDVGQQGAENGHYQLGFNAPDDESGAVIVEFSFDPPVYDLSLDLLDIDQGNFEDMARMRGFDTSGEPLPFDAVEAVTGFPDLFGDTWGGDTPTVPTNSSDGNITYTFRGPLETLAIEYFAGSTTEDPGDQFLGISDPIFCAYDFGDAPASYGTDGGAGPRHTLDDRDLYLGVVQADGEADGSPNATASGDGGDEDGVAAFPAGVVEAGDSYAVTVTVTNLTGASTNLCGWIDFDLDGGAGDGTFESDEGACVTVPAASGSNAACSEGVGGSGEFTCTLSFTVPGDFVYVPDEDTYARFRVSSDALGTGATNTLVGDGEVEDFRVPANTLPVTVAAFSSSAHLNGSQVRWSTTGEILTVGYRLYQIIGQEPAAPGPAGGLETLAAPASANSPANHTAGAAEALEAAEETGGGGEDEPAAEAPTAIDPPPGAGDDAPSEGEGDSDTWQLLNLWPTTGESAGSTTTLLPATPGDPFAPRVYEASLSGLSGAEGSAGAAAQDPWLVLAEVDHLGRERYHGPFRLGATYGREPEPFLIDWAQTADAAAPSVAPRGGGVSGLLNTESKPTGESDDTGATGAAGAAVSVSTVGVHRLTYEDLLAAGVDLAGAPSEALALGSPQRGPQRLWVQPATGPFGPGSVLEFWARGEETSLHTRTHVFHLTIDPDRALRARVRYAAPDAAPAASYLATETTDRNLAYTFAAPGDDPWYETSVLAFGGPGARELPFVIGPLDPGRRGEARLELTLWGITDWPGAAADHHVVVAVNGSEVAEVLFDGLVERTVAVDLPAGLLREGDNRILLQLPGDTGYDFDLIYVDRYAITYPRRFEARDDALRFTAKGPAYAVTDLSSPEVSVWSKDGKVRLDGVVVTPDVGGYQAAFRHPGSQLKSFDVAAGSARHLPGLAPWRGAPEDLLTGAADYLVVSHPTFLEGLDDLITTREAEGYSVKTVDVFDLYAAYTGGTIDPEAIRRYVADAHRDLGTRFLLLVGGDTSDPFDRLGLGSRSYLPTPYRATDPIIHYAPVDPVYGDVDNDGVPEVAVGRLPVRNAEELATVIAKTLAYPASRRHATFLADSLASGLFTSTSESFREKLPETFTSSAYYLDTASVDSARQGLFDAFAAGDRLIHYLGHSGPAAWTFDGLFSSADIDALATTGQPAAVVQWGCWNTYHVSPRYDTLGHRLLLAGPQGAAAVLGASTLTTVTSDRDLGQRVLAALSEPGVPLGTAILRAKADLHRAYGGQPPQDVMLGWTLLGDPALVVSP